MLVLYHTYTLSVINSAGFFTSHFLSIAFTDSFWGAYFNFWYYHDHFNVIWHVSKKHQSMFQQHRAGVVSARVWTTVNNTERAWFQLVCEQPSTTQSGRGFSSCVNNRQQQYPIKNNRWNHKEDKYSTNL